MPRVYLVVDHYTTPYFKQLAKIHSRFFITNPLAFPTTVFKQFDVIVDNGTYTHGKPRYSYCIRALRMNVRFIMPDYLASPERTLREHIRFIEFIECNMPSLAKRVRKLGFVVLQGRTYDEYLQALDTLKEHLIFDKVAIGGLRRIKQQLALQLALQLRKKYYVHVLGTQCKYAHSFDTSWWGYRFLDQRKGKINNAIERIKQFIQRWESLP